MNRGSFPYRYHDRKDEPPWWALLLMWLVAVVVNAALWGGLIFLAVWLIMEITR